MRVRVLLFIFILLIALALRAPEVISGNQLFGFDQGRDYLAAYKIAEEHKLTLIGAEVGAGSAGISGLFHGPGYFYLLALMYVLFHGDPYGGLVLMFTFGMAACFLSFVIGKRLFGTSGGLLCFFLVATAPLIAPQSRFIWNHHLTSPLILLYLYTLWKIITTTIETKTKIRWVVMNLVLAGSLYHFELATSVPLIVSTFVVLRFVVVEKRLSIYGIALCTALFSYTPMVMFEARHGFMAFRGILGYLTTGGSHESTSFLLRISRQLGSFLANARDTFVFEYGYVTPPWYVIFVQIFLLLTITAYFLQKDETKKRFISSLYILIGVSFVVFLFLNNSVWNYYLLHLHFVYILLFVASLVTFAQTIGPNVRGIIAALGIVFLTFFLISIGKGTERRIVLNIGTDLPDYGGKEKVFGKKAVIDRIYADAKGQIFNVLVFTPPVYTYPYDYLFKTYAKKTYGFTPGQEKKGLVYLIMEIDGTKPWSYQGWLDTVIQGGTILSHEYIKKEDVILEKRMF